MGCKILVADDEKINRRMLRVIYDSRYELLEAKDGVQTIEMIEQYGDELDLILLDLQMPKKTGFDVLDFMREHGYLSQIPVIIITASDDQTDELRAFDCGATELVRKPFVPEIVLRRSETLIELYSSRKRVIRELIKSRDQLTDVQKKDSLTGLLNRKAFLEAANQVLQEMQNVDHDGYRFIHVNITNFKFYNVLQGIIGGDMILQMMAEQILDVEPNVLCSRWGQDHFVVMTRDDCQTIRSNMNVIASHFNERFGQYGMQVKAGVYSMEDCTQKADVACELAKLACDSIRQSTETFCVYNEELHQRVESQTYVIQHIDEALNNQYIEVYYQPIIRTDNGKTCSLEALARWNDPKRGFLSPADFIPALENNHLITRLDLYVLRKTCQGMKHLKEMGYTLIPVSFNFSRIDFLSCNLLEEVNRIASEYEIPRELICVEITETAIMKEQERMQQEITLFQEAGYQVWMDDFGSGYSSLNMLKEYQFDEIKLDMKFLSSIDDKSKEIITAVVSMAKKIGVQTLAEGVETEEQYEFLKSIGCEKVQGYLFCKPIPAREILSSELLTCTQKDHSDQTTLTKTTMRHEMEEVYRHYSDYLEKDIHVRDLPTAQRMLDLQSSMLRSIASMYVVMYLGDLEKNTFVEIYAMDHVKKLFGAEKTISGVLSLVNQYFVAPEFREEAERFNDVTTLPDRLKGKKILSMDYNATIAGWCRQQFIPVTWDEDGRAREIICVEQRIQAEKMQVESLRKLAETDGMTQLLYRSSGADRINQYLSEDSHGMFCLFDVDDFKQYNDKYGHAVGDKVLKGISSCMKATFRNVDVLVRAGGDEFVIYALGIVDPVSGEKKIKEFEQSVQELQFDEFSEPVHISSGVVFSNQYPGESFEGLFKIADERMYKRKNAKKQTIKENKVDAVE